MTNVFHFLPGINLKKASKSFAQKFSCGSSVSGEDEIIVQGDVTDDLIDLILETYEVKLVILAILLLLQFFD